MNRYEQYASLLPRLIGSQEGPVSPPVVGSASFAYGTPDNAEAIFSGSVAKPVYSRMGNPTTAKLESVIAAVDGAAGAVATSSGMAALNLAILGLCAAGDEIIAVGGLFGGTFSMLGETLKRYGITTRFFDVDEHDAIEKAINANTKVLFCESVGNPNMRLPDLRHFAALADEHALCFIVDNTITPIAVAPLELGADMVVYSTTKIMNGSASALGGAVAFRGIGENDKFRHEKFKFLHPFIDKAGKNALVMNAKKRVMRDFGFSANAFASYLTLLGLETLPLRAKRIAENIEILAKNLESAGFAVRHPSLSAHEHHALYKKEFTHGCGTLLTVDMGSKERAFRLLEKMERIFITANIGDSRTLAIHAASTIYRDFNAAQQKQLGITEGLIRVSLGLENPGEIAGDFIQAAKKI